MKVHSAIFSSIEPPKPPHVQGWPKRLVRGCEKFVPALAKLLCLALPGSCLARFACFFADLCTGMAKNGGLGCVNCVFLVRKVTYGNEKDKTFALSGT